VNKYRPHVYILPEDDANRQLAVGFQLFPSLDLRQVQVLSPAGGWQVVVHKFLDSHLADLQKNKNQHMVLLLDFDESEERRASIQEQIPAEVEEQVFLIGVWSEPEELKAETGKSFEEMGTELAKECYNLWNYPDNLWNHPLLQHNRAERQRMQETVSPILFR